MEITDVIEYLLVPALFLDEIRLYMRFNFTVFTCK